VVPSPVNLGLGAEIAYSSRALLLDARNQSFRIRAGAFTPPPPIHRPASSSTTCRTSTGCLHAIDGSPGGAVMATDSS
jgi:hypothetical protein